MTKTRNITVPDSSATRSSQYEPETVCLSCGRRMSVFQRICPDCPSSLLRCVYPEKRFVTSAHPGIFRFRNWLPLKPNFNTTFNDYPEHETALETRIGPVVYQSEALAAKLGLNRLFIAYDGYAPSKGAFNLTASFKDFEALPTLLFLRQQGINSVTLATAGNTGRAFAYAGILLGFNVHIVIPEGLLPGLWVPLPPDDHVRVTVIADSFDYFRAIELNQLIVREYGLTDEGGARNIARRDGMGTVVLEYARQTGELPRHYFQAVGSGTGGIAAWEAALRLQGDDRFKGQLPVLHLAQNTPFTPIHNAWTHNIPIQPNNNINNQLADINKIRAGVLANRNPPYDVTGGVRDALQATRGRTYAIDNSEIDKACALFNETEGASIGPEAGVALGALQQAVQQGHIGNNDSILLHVTGGGDDLLRKDYDLYQLKPACSVRAENVTRTGISQFLSYFRNIMN